MNFGVLIFPNVEELDFVGPWEIAGMWSKVVKVPENRYIVAQSTEPLICAKGLSVNPHLSFEQCSSVLSTTRHQSLMAICIKAQ